MTANHQCQCGEWIGLEDRYCVSCLEDIADAHDCTLGPEDGCEVCQLLYSKGLINKESND